VLSESADVCYKMDAPYAPEFDATLRYDDPKVAIAWPAPPQQLSARDRGGEAFDAVVRRVPPWTPEPHSPAAEPSRAL
jgi:dTDP-4-dehydrorhamnose 3,5-epimerase